MKQQSTFSTLLKEPLLHFLLIGAGLFLLFSQLNDDEIHDSQQIIIEKPRLTLLIDNYIKENNKKPSQKELQALFNKDIQEEILYREALAIGLDKNDKVIRHRLAQKMKYIFQDLSMTDDLSNDNEDYYKNLRTNYTIQLDESLQKEFNLSITK